MTRRLLSTAKRPTAIIYDNDVMAVAGAAVAHEMGVEVPRDLSITAWDDSVLCQIVHPPLSAVSRDISAYGAEVAEALLDQIDGKPVQDFRHQTPRLVTRGSTARAPVTT